MNETNLEHQIVVAIRRIIRAVDRHSRKLAQTCGLTGPQALLLQELCNNGKLATGELARHVHLAQGTVSEILDRLEERGMVKRRRSASDQRKVEVSATPAARELIERRPSLLQERFASELGKLVPWEQHLILAALERVATMMDAEALDAAPVLSSGPITSTVEVTARFLDEEK